MNAEVFAEWLRRQGHRVVRTESSYWYDAWPRVFQAFPYHWVIEPSRAELREFFLDHKAIALRYSAPLSNPFGKISYHVVCDDPSYDLASLPRQTRQNVRRGLECATIERIPISRLASEGWSLRQDTLERQGRAGAETEEAWQRLCQSAQDLLGFEAWGAIYEGKLAASFLAFRCNDWYTLPYEQSATAYLESRINNAIFYRVTQEAIRSSGVAGVFFCLQSLDAPSSVDQFKFRMGLTARAVRQRVVFHPWLEPFLVKPAYKAIKGLLDRQPNRPALAKLEGMLRFYHEGKCLPIEQEWPECLRERRSEVLQGLTV